MFILADGQTPFLRTILFVNIVFGLGNEGEPNEQRNALTVIERGQKVDPFDGPLMRMIVIPTDDVVLIGVRFFRDAIVDNHRGVVALDASHKGFGDLP
jgi:hypothetical protein